MHPEIMNLKLLATSTWLMHKHINYHSNSISDAQSNRYNKLMNLQRLSSARNQIHKIRISSEQKYSFQEPVIGSKSQRGHQISRKPGSN